MEEDGNTNAPEVEEDLIAKAEEDFFNAISAEVLQLINTRLSFLLDL